MNTSTGEEQMHFSKRGFFNLTPAQVAAIADAMFEKDAEVTTRDLSPYYRKHLHQTEESVICAMCNFKHLAYDGRVYGCVVVCKKCGIEVQRCLPAGFRYQMFRVVYGQCVTKFRTAYDSEKQKSEQNQHIARKALEVLSKPLSAQALEERVAELKAKQFGHIPATKVSQEPVDYLSLFEDETPDTKRTPAHSNGSTVEFVPDVDDAITVINEHDVADWQSQDFKRHYFDVLNHRRNVKTRLGDVLFYAHLVKKYQHAFDTIIRLWSGRFSNECAQFQAESQKLREERKLLSRLEDIQRRAESSDVSVGITADERAFLDSHKDQFVELRAKYAAKKHRVSDDEQAQKDFATQKRTSNYRELRRQFLTNPDSLSAEDRTFVENKMRSEQERKERVRKKHESAATAREARKNSADKKGGRKKK